MESTAGRLIRDAALVVVDFDGTLVSLSVDWDRLRAQLALEAARAGAVWHRTEGLDANLRRIRSVSGEEVFQRLCGVVAEAEVAGFDPGRVHRRLLALLQARGARPLGVVSLNTRTALQSVLAHPVWAGITPLVVGKEEVAQGKPHPEGLLQVCAHFQVSPAQAVYVGDAATDEVAARRAGFHAFIRAGATLHPCWWSAPDAWEQAA